MTENQKLFVQLKPASSQIKLGDGKLQQVEGRGVVAVYTKGGIKKLIHDVLYVPGIAQIFLVFDN